MKSVQNTIGADKKLFFRYVVPSMISMLLAGIYTLVDGLFVGWGTGPNGLAAINVAYPLIIAIVALGELVGSGGAITIAYCHGRNLSRNVDRFFMSVLSIIIPVGIILSLLSPLAAWSVKFMGAAPEILDDARAYAFIMVAGCLFQLLSIALVAVMRHDGAPRRAMFIMLAGLFANILLDYLLVIVIPWGVRGSAYASVAAQMLTFVLAASYFLHGKNKFVMKLRYAKPDLKRYGHILRLGVPSLGIQASAALLLLLYNLQSLRYGGVAGLAAYAIICYVSTSFILILEGVAIGMQPIVSYLHGSEEEAKKKQVLKMGLQFAFLVGMAGALISVAGNQLIPKIFHAGPQITPIVSVGLLLSAAAFPFFGLVQVIAAYFQAEHHPWLSGLLIYGDSCVILPVMIFILPLFWGLNGVWMALAASKLVMMIVALILQQQRKNHSRDGKSLNRVAAEAV